MGKYSRTCSGIQKNDFPLIGRSLNDVIIEPIRSILIPKFDEIKEKSLQIGSLGGEFRIRTFHFMLSEKRNGRKNCSDDEISL